MVYLDASTANDMTDSGRFSSDRLLAANIHPDTRLATDYLNHFNEVVMLFDLVARMPEIREDIRLWQPRSYQDHFRASGFKGRDLAISAYETVEPGRRRLFEQTIAGLDDALCKARDMLPSGEPFAAERVRLMLEQDVRPLLAKAMALINGTPVALPQDEHPARSDEQSAAQTEIDAMFPA